MEIANQINVLSIAQKLDIDQKVEKERRKLLSYIKKQVNNVADAEDILQDVLYQFVESSFFLKPIEQASAWLFAVARNRITDVFRKKKNLNESDFNQVQNEGDEEFSDFFAQMLLDEADPEFEMSRQLILDELAAALDELPKKQREAFERNELQGVSFKQMAQESGETVNTWISRKHYAVLHLRKRLQTVYNEFFND